MIKLLVAQIRCYGWCRSRSQRNSGNSCSECHLQATISPPLTPSLSLWNAQEEVEELAGQLPGIMNDNKFLIWIISPSGYCLLRSSTHFDLFLIRILDLLLLVQYLSQCRPCVFIVILSDLSLNQPRNLKPGGGATKQHSSFVRRNHSERVIPIYSILSRLLRCSWVLSPIPRVINKISVQAQARERHWLRQVEDRLIDILRTKFELAWFSSGVALFCAPAIVIGGGE